MNTKPSPPEWEFEDYFTGALPELGAAHVPGPAPAEKEWGASRDGESRDGSLLAEFEDYFTGVLPDLEGNEAREGTGAGFAFAERGRKAPRKTQAAGAPENNGEMEDIYS